MTNLSRRKMLAGTAGAIAAAGIAVSAKAASFGNPDRPPEGAVNVRNRQSLTDPALKPGNRQSIPVLSGSAGYRYQRDAIILGVIQ